MKVVPPSSLAVLWSMKPGPDGKYSAQDAKRSMVSMVKENSADPEPESKPRVRFANGVWSYRARIIDVKRIEVTPAEAWSQLERITEHNVAAMVAKGCVTLAYCRGGENILEAARTLINADKYLKQSNKFPLARLDLDGGVGLGLTREDDGTLWFIRDNQRMKYGRTGEVIDAKDVAKWISFASKHVGNPLAALKSNYSCGQTARPYTVQGVNMLFIEDGGEDRKLWSASRRFGNPSSALGEVCAILRIQPKTDIDEEDTKELLVSQTS